MSRTSFLTTAQFTQLNDACIMIAEAFGETPYLVGSANRDRQYRDVDIRLILSDEDFDHWFRGRLMLWSLVCLAIGRHLADVTRLPVDFQIQRMTEANERYGDGFRNPMGMRARPYAGGGDATSFGGEA